MHLVFPLVIKFALIVIKFVLIVSQSVVALLNLGKNGNDRRI